MGFILSLINLCRPTCSQRMHTTASSLVAIAEHLKKILYGSQQKFNIESVNDYPPIRFDIRFERKFPIRRSLVSNVTAHPSIPISYRIAV